MQNVINVSVSLKPEMYEQINTYCKERGCSRSWFFDKASSEFLKEYLEDKADYETAVASWIDFEKNGGKTFTSKELRTEFGL